MNDMEMDSDRAAFEAWADSNGWFLERSDDGFYRSKEIECMFMGWQAHAALSAATVPDIKTMVDRFLSWQLPRSVRPDDCVMSPDYPYRYGTNLLTSVEAEAMLHHVLIIPQRHTGKCQHCQTRNENQCNIDDHVNPGMKLYAIPSSDTELV